MLRTKLIHAIEVSALLRIIVSLVLFYSAVEVASYQAATRMMGQYALLIEANRIKRHVSDDAFEAMGRGFGTALFSAQSLMGELPVSVGGEILPTELARKSSRLNLANIASGPHEVSVEGFNRKGVRTAALMRVTPFPLAPPQGTPSAYVLPQARSFTADLTLSAGGAAHIMCTGTGADIEIFKGAFIGKVNGATWTSVTVQVANPGDTGNSLAKLLTISSAGALVADQTLTPFTAGPITLRVGSALTYIINGSTGSGSFDAKIYFGSVGAGSCQP